MQRGVGVTGNGVGLLNVQTTKPDSIGSVEVVGVRLLTKEAKEEWCLLGCYAV
jgi:hypothetical protein